MAQTTTIPSTLYPAGTTAWGPITIPSGNTKLTITLTRESWPDSAGVEIISIEAVVSFDNGQTWSGELGVNPTFQFGTAGGDLPLDKFGQPQTTSRAIWPIVTPCRIKGVVTLTQPLTTAITVALT